MIHANDNYRIDAQTIEHRGDKRQELNHSNANVTIAHNNTYTHSPGMPHTPGISYVNGVGYLDVGTAPASVINRFNDFIRGFSSLSHSLCHLLAREQHLCRKYRFQSPADSRWLLPLTQRDASGMNNELTDAVRRLDSLVVRQRLDSRAAALEELLLGDTGNPPEVLSNSIEQRMKFHTNDPANDIIDSRLHGGIPVNISQVAQQSHNGQTVVEERIVELPYNPNTNERINLITSSNQNRLHSGDIQAQRVNSNAVSIVDNPVKMVVSGKKKKFACHICGKEYNTKQYVKQHVKSIHKQDGKSPITVTIDSKTQQTQFPNNLNGLVGNGQESQFIQKRFICHADGCGMKFQTSILLQKHQRNVHGMLSTITNNNQPSISIPQTTTQSPSRALVPSSTSGGSNRQVANPGEEEVNMVECDICGKNVREQSLPAHKKRHELAEKRPFKCDICGKGFMRTVTLRDHMNTHNGVKPHKCRVCGRGWASRPNMLKHVREKHPEARIPMGENQNNSGARVLSLEAPNKENEIDVKTDGIQRPPAIEYHPNPDHLTAQNIQVTTAGGGLSGATITEVTQAQGGDIQSILHRTINSSDTFRPAHSIHLPMRTQNTTIVTQSPMSSIPMDHT